MSSNSIEISLDHVLGERSLRFSKYLVVACITKILLVIGVVVPEQINVYGAKISNVGVTNIKYFLSAWILFFLFRFSLEGARDLAIWLTNYLDVYRKTGTEGILASLGGVLGEAGEFRQFEGLAKPVGWMFQRLQTWLPIITAARLSLDLIFPIVLAVSTLAFFN